MTKRRVLDVTSVKKRDNMALYDYNTPANTAISVPGGPVGSIRSYLWAATARDRQDSFYQANRTSKNVYWKGIKETITFTCTTAVSWKWRRIVFSVKGYKPENSYTELSNGNYRRTWNPTVDATLPTKLFQGTSGVDFTSVTTANVDTDWCKLLYDKTRIFRSGNQSPHEHMAKIYIPLEATMNYDEDENGGMMDSTYWASPGIKGMGDVFILDYFECIQGASTDIMQIRSQTTAYWHEK